MISLNTKETFEDVREINVHIKCISKEKVKFKVLTSLKGYSTNSMGELFKVSIPLVSTNDDISKYFLLSGGKTESGKNSDGE